MSVLGVRKNPFLAVTPNRPVRTRKPAGVARDAAVMAAPHADQENHRKNAAAVKAARANPNNADQAPWRRAADQPDARTR